MGIPGSRFRTRLALSRRPASHLLSLSGPICAAGQAGLLQEARVVNGCKRVGYCLLFIYLISESQQITSAGI